MELVLSPDFDEAGRKALNRWVELVFNYNENIAPYIGPLNNDPTLNEQEQADCDMMVLDSFLVWRKDQSRLEEAQWLNIFPQAKKRYGRLIKGKLKLEKKYALQRIQQERISAIAAIRANRPESGWLDDVIRENLQRKTRDLERRIRTIDALIKVVERCGKKAEPEKESAAVITPEMIKRAREYPLEKLIEINKQKFTKCFKHADKTPSAYCKNNFIHCFVCQETWDTIAVLRERDGMTFREAVIKLQ